MEEAEKMVALKRAYADIILNTAKEAAARIMVLEQKAEWFRKEAVLAKEEATNMLFRMKQAMDSKIAEAEIVSLHQTRKIEELEARIHESNNVARDLRAEMKQLQDEIQIMQKTMQPSDKRIADDSFSSYEDASQETKLLTTESISLPFLDSQPSPVLTSNMKVSVLSQRNTVDACSLVQENLITENGPPNDPIEENPDAGNSDLVSIIMTSKEPELYRNGCTQRICAFEGNLSNGGSPLLGQAENKYSLTSESVIREDKSAEKTCVMAPLMDGREGLKEMNPTGLKESLQKDSSCDNGQALMPLFRVSSKKRRSSASRFNHAMKGCERPNLEFCKTYPCTRNNDDLSLRINEKVAPKASNSQLVLGSSLKTAEKYTSLGCADGVHTDAKIVKKGNDHNDANMNRVLKDEMKLIKLDNQDVDILVDPGSRLNLDSLHVALVDSDNNDDKNCKMTNGAPNQTESDRFLKYTFQRKRKRGSVSIHDESVSLESDLSKCRSSEKTLTGPEPQKSDQATGSSRESRRLVQVARQLISLSEKRW